MIDDANALTRDAPWLRAVAPILSGRQQIKFGANNANVDVVATTAANSVIERLEVTSGRFFSEGENEQRRRVVVIGSDIPSELKLEDADPATLVGQELQVRGVPFEIIGVLAPSNRDGRGDPDESVFIPLNTGRDRVFGTERLQSITVQLRDPSAAMLAILDIEAVLRRMHHLRPGVPNDFRIQDNSQFLAARAEASATMTYLLAGIAAVSLVVGGIGIMNIMLVSVTERTREIGVRKALGATRRNVLTQFLLEAIVLCLAGGVIGVGVGYGTSQLLAHLNGWAMAVTPESVLVAVCFSAVVGVFFGVWPARRAARLDPIEALRYE
jgi:putative ABC transport system permease protein